MFIRLIPDQVPRMWDNIKFAIARTGDINERDMPLYLNSLLHALLSGKAQCVVKLDGDDRKLMAMGITRIIKDVITGENILFIECFYSFAKISEDEWKELAALSVKFAKKEKCVKLSTYSSNPRIYEIAKNVGFKEYYRYFIMEV